MMESTNTEAAWPQELITRTFPLGDMAIPSGQMTCERCGREATGRMVEAYAAVYNVDTEVSDQHGHYIESIDRSAFSRAIDHWSRSKGIGNVAVFYNHGKTLYDTPSSTFSLTLGHPAAIRADDGGLVTVTHYGRTELSENVLRMIQDGDISGHSFTGRIYKSDPDRPPGRSRNGTLPHVRRMVLGLSEYGPTPQPYYESAQVLAVRSGQATDQYSDDGPTGTAPPPPQGPGTEDQREAHSGRQADIARRIRRAMLARESADQHANRPPHGDSPAAG